MLSCRELEILRDSLPRAITLYPCILGEYKSMELFTEVLYHVVTFWFTVHKQVQADFLLETDNLLNFFLDEVIILFLCEFTLPEFETC